MKPALLKCFLATTAFLPLAGAEEKIGNAWSDARNPVAVSFRGQRLDLWSLQPVRPTALPLPDGESAERHEIDRLLLPHYHSQSLGVPSPADARTLGRRLYTDLTGLPPAPAQMANFLARAGADGLDRAATALTEDLLASPRFGEHFSRFWLDVARYSDSNGFDWDEFRPLAYRYRDYVIRAFNGDKPYDQFLTEQLAGDELVEDAKAALPTEDRLIATGFLRLGPWDNSAAAFNEQDRARDELLTDLTETTGSAFLGLTMSCCRCHDHKYDPITQADHYRLRAFFAPVTFTDEFQIRDQLKDIPVTHVLQQGDYKTRREAVTPGFLSVLDPNSADIPSPPNPQNSGRRLALARWITAPENPLAARVMVNRLWQNLLQHPLVATPNDFGRAGIAPHHPVLLDWLAAEFIKSGWSIKHMVRLISGSAAYRQASGNVPATFALRQPRRLGAEQLRDAILAVSGLLDGKSGGPPAWPELPPELLSSNPAFLDDNKEKTKGWYPSPLPEQHARSIFVIQKRNTRVPLLETFDLPDNSTSCARRDTSTVAPQALTLLNSPMMKQAAEALAARVAASSSAEAAPPVQQLFQLALQRDPGAEESAECETFIATHSLTELCRVILNLNEFIYVD